jgi:hypothetical protein
MPKMSRRLGLGLGLGLGVAFRLKGRRRLQGDLPGVAARQVQPAAPWAYCMNQP